jgi:uncharacterized protein YjbJ (UPF0337 family)
MSTPSSPSPSSSTPGGELLQISPGAWPTANGGQTENRALAASPPPSSAPESINGVAEQLRDNWERVKGNLRKKYGELTDDDLLYGEGQELAVIERIRQKTGCSIDEIKEALNQPG